MCDMFVGAEEVGMEQKRAILIAGPTASGKSAVAVELARQHDVVIINADSMQVYQVLRIITACPEDEDLDLVPHQLYRTVSPAVRYSVGAWLEDVTTILETVFTAGKMPVFVGGTGLYFKALTEGLAAIPDIPADINEAWRERGEAEGFESLHKLLSERDSNAAARIKPGDGQRIVRALAVLDATGRTLDSWHQEQPSPPLLPLAECDTRVLLPDRAVLYARIEKRLDQMIELGALAEIEALMALELDPTLPAMKALGVPRFMAMLRGDLGQEDAMRLAKTDTRQYAKRQLTWCRNQMTEWQKHEF
jgi:tRNA dimethylallyltransferase